MFSVTMPQERRAGQRKGEAAVNEAMRQKPRYGFEDEDENEDEDEDDVEFEEDQPSTIRHQPSITIGGERSRRCIA
jgi:hypothetical protein